MKRNSKTQKDSVIEEKLYITLLKKRKTIKVKIVK